MSRIVAEYAGSFAKDSLPARENPFRVSRLQELPFHLYEMDWPDLMGRLETLNYRAAIVGPHGSGKTTLMERIGQRLQEKGFSVVPLFMNNDDGSRLPAKWRDAIMSCSSEEIILADGYDHLSLVGRSFVRRHSRKACGLIVTSHKRSVLMTLIRTRTTWQLLENLVEHLLKDSGWEFPSRSCIQDLFRRHRGNLREALRELYDRVDELDYCACRRPPISH